MQEEFMSAAAGGESLRRRNSAFGLSEAGKQVVKCLIGLLEQSS